MKRLFNFRLPVFYAAALATGILFAALWAYLSIDAVWLAAPALIIFVSAFVCGLVKKKAAPVVVLLFAAVIFLSGAIYGYALYLSHVQREVFIDGAVTVYGTVRETGMTSSGSRYIVIGNVRFGNTQINGKLIAYLSETAGDYCRRGYSVSFSSEPRLLDFFSGDGVSYYAAKGIKYSCTVTENLEARYGFSLFGGISAAVENLLYSNLDGETAAVALAMLTGNSDMISEGTLSAFRYGGIAHIFAVSGLHIGVIFGVLTKIFKRAGLNRFLSAAVRIIFIVMFAGVCGFSPSSVRAVVMCSVSALASCLYKRYDSWNALSLSAIILLLINPLYLFDVGFVLSFGAMLGIILLSHTLSSALAFLPYKIRSTAAVGWSAQLATLPVLAHSFGYVSWAGLILNLIFVPAISALYVLLFSATVVCLILPFAAPIMAIAATPTEFLINIVVTCGFENAVIAGDFGLWVYAPFIILTLALSDKFNLRVYVRGALAAVSVIALICVIVIPLCRKTSVQYAEANAAAFKTTGNGGESAANYGFYDDDILTYGADGGGITFAFDCGGSLSAYAAYGD